MSTSQSARLLFDLPTDMKTAVIIPALNEAGNIGKLVRETLARPVDWVFVVDNGSTDETAVIIPNPGAADPDFRRQPEYFALCGRLREMMEPVS